MCPSTCLSSSPDTVAHPRTEGYVIFSGRMLKIPKGFPFVLYPSRIAHNEFARDELRQKWKIYIFGFSNASTSTASLKNKHETPTPPPSNRITMLTEIVDIQRNITKHIV